MYKLYFDIYFIYTSDKIIIYPIPGRRDRIEAQNGCLWYSTRSFHSFEIILPRIEETIDSSHVDTRLENNFVPVPVWFTTLNGHISANSNIIHQNEMKLFPSKNIFFSWIKIQKIII